MKNILHIIPHANYFPPKNGGAIRCHNITLQLAKENKVTLLTLQSKKDFYDAFQKNVEVLNPNKKNLKNVTLLNKLFNTLLYKWKTRLPFRQADGSFLTLLPKLKELLIHRHYDYIIFEFISSIHLAYATRRLSPKTILIGDLHNVDHVLYKQNTKLKTRKDKKYYNQLKFDESRLHKKLDYFFACSEVDKIHLEELNKRRIRGIVIPNGATIYKNRSSIEKNINSILFCGSLDYKPNQEGLMWFYDSIWPLIKKEKSNVEFTIIGKNSSSPFFDSIKNDKSVNFIGEVDDVIPYYKKSNIAIIPLKSGSGTRLKVLEAMSLGNPVVSTSIGAEGIEYIHGKNLCIADNEIDFSVITLKLINDQTLANQITDNALELVNKKYSWDSIGLKLNSFLNNF